MNGKMTREQRRTWAVALLAPSDTEGGEWDDKSQTGVRVQYKALLTEGVLHTRLQSVAMSLSTMGWVAALEAAGVPGPKSTSRRAADRDIQRHLRGHVIPAIQRAGPPANEWVPARMGDWFPSMYWGWRCGGTWSPKRRWSGLECTAMMLAEASTWRHFLHDRPEEPRPPMAQSRPDLTTMDGFIGAWLTETDTCVDDRGLW